MDKRLGHTDVRSAIDEVLGAEREALAEIASSQSRADEILKEARQSARALLRRNQARLSRLHAGCAARTRELVNDVERGSEAYDACAVPADEERAMLDNAIRALASELTTKGGGDAD
jgi:vacuolar-type H+-ATPase subunit H